MYTHGSFLLLKMRRAEGAWATATGIYGGRQHTQPLTTSAQTSALHCTVVDSRLMSFPSSHTGSKGLPDHMADMPEKVEQVHAY